MIKSTVEPECTGQFSPLYLDYIQQKEKIKPFYNLFPSLDNFKKFIKKRSFPLERRVALVQSLKKQYENFALTEETRQNIEILSEPQTFTVTTGHQLNLFTGPLYFIYKIVSTINLAEKLKQTYPEYNFVPIYWMASEDHDFAEINHFYFDGKNHYWNTDQEGAVGEFKLDQGIKNLINDSPFVPDFFKAAYGEQETLADAVRYYVNYLFGDKGLVVLDAHSHDLKSLFKTVIKDDLLNNTAHELVGSASEQLDQMGYKTQVFPREINFFYLDKGLRSRIEKVGERFNVLDSRISFSEKELLELIETSPERFSPNVVLRPLYQEWILPNIAYLGGAAEVAYWLQLKSMFDHYQTDFPAIMPRNFVMVLDNNAQRKINALGLADSGVFSDYNEWKKDYTIKHAGQDILLEPEKAQMDAIFEAIAQKATHADPTLKPSAIAARSRAMKILDQFTGKLRKAEERTLSSALSQMSDLKSSLFPEQVPQERKDNLLLFYLKDPSFIQKLYPHLDPLDFDFIILRTDGQKK